MDEEGYDEEYDDSIEESTEELLEEDELTAEEEAFLKGYEDDLGDDEEEEDIDSEFE